MMVALTVASVITALAIPYFGDTRTARIASAFEALHSHVLLAQSSSMANPTAPSSISLFGTGYVVEGSAQTVSVVFASQTATDGVVLEWESLETPVLEFNHYGALALDPDAPNPVLTLSIPGCSTALEVTLQPSSGSVQGEWVSVN